MGVAARAMNAADRPPAGARVGLLALGHGQLTAVALGHDGPVLDLDELVALELGQLGDGRIGGGAIGVPEHEQVLLLVVAHGPTLSCLVD